MGGQWEEEKAWGTPNVVEEKRGCHLQEDRSHHSAVPHPVTWATPHLWPCSLSVSLHQMGPPALQIKASRTLLRVFNHQEALP